MIRSIIMGAILVIFSSIIMRKLVRASLKCRMPAVATIVEVKRSSFGRDGSLYIPIVEFSANGQTIRGESAGMSGDNSADKYHEGDTVEIRFNEKKPKEFVLKGDSNKVGFIITGIFLLIGVLLLFSGIVGLIRK